MQWLFCKNLQQQLIFANFVNTKQTWQVSNSSSTLTYNVKVRNNLNIREVKILITNAEITNRKKELFFKSFLTKWKGIKSVNKE